MDITHVLHQLSFCLFFGVKLLEFLDERLCHWDQSFFGPGQKPVDGALIKEGWEFSEPVSEFLSDWWKAEANMEIVSDSVYEIGV